MDGLLAQNEYVEDINVSYEKLATIIYKTEKVPVPGMRFIELLSFFEFAKNELPKTCVTKQILWIEYREQYLLGYQYR